MTQPTTEELRTLIEKAAMLMGIEGRYARIHQTYGDQWIEGINTGAPVFWNPYTSAHDNVILRIRAGVTAHHVRGVGAEAYVDDTEFEAFVKYPDNPTDTDKLQCEFLAVLCCAGAILDEREKA